MKNIEELKAQIIKDKVGIFHENDEALFNRIVEEFEKRGFSLSHENLFDKRFTSVVYDKFDATINSVNHNYINAHSINIITLEEFIARYPLEEREIVGYVFKDFNKWRAFDTSDVDWLETNYTNHGLHFPKDYCNLYNRLVNAGLLEVLCEPVYKEVEKRGEFIGLPVAPPSQISFNTKEDSTPILKLCGNGDIFVKGKLIENDKEIVDALREFVKQSSDDFDSTIKELGFVKVENEKLSDKLMIEHKEYILEYEGYAYVLYKIIKKEIPSANLQLKEPIAHFQDANKLKAFVNILKDQF